MEGNRTAEYLLIYASPVIFLTLLFVSTFLDGNNGDFEPNQDILGMIGSTYAIIVFVYCFMKLTVIREVIIVVGTVGTIYIIYPDDPFAIVLSLVASVLILLLYNLAMQDQEVSAAFQESQYAAALRDDIWEWVCNSNQYIFDANTDLEKSEVVNPRPLTDHEVESSNLLADEEVVKNIQDYAAVSEGEFNTTTQPSIPPLLEIEHEPRTPTCRRFTFAEIQLATHDFDDAFVIGKGGFGKVYKGCMNDNEPGSTVAIKRLDSTSKQGSKEFWTEIHMLSQFRHTHLVSLIGYCNECNEMILVYEYMSKGSLADHLLKKEGTNVDTSMLCWVERLKICIGAARGLEYLHSGTGFLQRVIHRDLKSSNILLDENWAAKISDFGLSKIGPANQSCSHVSTRVMGTRGYIDPDYLLTHRLTRKSDVYAFGVVLFEILSGRQALDLKLPVEQRGLALWAQQCIREDRGHILVDSNLNWEIFPDSLKEFLKIAEQCLHSCPKKRPKMSEVVTLLESALDLQERKDSSLLDNNYDFDFGGEFTENKNARTSSIQLEVISSGRPRRKRWWKIRRVLQAVT